MLNKDNNMLCLSHRLLLVIAFLGLFLFEYGIKITAAQDQTKQTKSLTAEEEAEQLMRQGVIDAINWFNAQQDKISQSQQKTRGNPLALVVGRKAGSRFYIVRHPSHPFAKSVV